MNCSICHLPVRLVPSAEERAAKTGYPAAFFTGLFKTHADCALEKRAAETTELMRRTAQT